MLSAMATRAVLGWVMAPPTRITRAAARAGGRLASRVAMSSAEHDYLVIGGGSGGIASARRAATYGKRVAVVERGGTGGLGGACVNVGCVPKIMFNAATVTRAVHEAHQFKFEGDADALKLNWGAWDARDKYITRLNGIYEHNLANSDVEKVTAPRASLAPTPSRSTAPTARRPSSRRTTCSSRSAARRACPTSRARSTASTRTASSSSRTCRRASRSSARATSRSRWPASSPRLAARRSSSCVARRRCAGRTSTSWAR